MLPPINLTANKSKALHFYDSYPSVSWLLLVLLHSAAAAAVSNAPRLGETSGGLPKRHVWLLLLFRDACKTV